jgi:hypothetical protein
MDHVWAVFMSVDLDVKHRLIHSYVEGDRSGGTVREQRTLQ